MKTVLSQLHTEILETYSAICTHKAETFKANQLALAHLGDQVRLFNRMAERPEAQIDALFMPASGQTLEPEPKPGSADPGEYPPQDAEDPRPWYPDDSPDWVEVGAPPPAGRRFPDGLNSGSAIQVLFAEERRFRRSRGHIGFTWQYDWHRQDLRTSIVAYKLLATKQQPVIWTPDDRPWVFVAQNATEIPLELNPEDPIHVLTLGNVRRQRCIQGGARPAASYSWDLAPDDEDRIAAYLPESDQ